MLQGPVGAPSGPEPVGDRPKLGLEDWLENCFDRALNDAIFHRGNAQGSELPRLARLWDEPSP
jgi:hypothetical protein